MLANSAQLSALGEMAGGVAHEINNPLTIILGYTEKIERLLAKEPIVPTEIQITNVKIQAAVFRIAKIVTGLKKISRDGANDELEDVELNRLIEEVVGICAEKFKLNGIDLQIGQISNIQILGRQVQLSQVILNLLNNAFDAVETFKEKWVRIEVSEDQDFSYISITDCGKGIPLELQEKILRPFFTTKPIGKGTGLGLSISASIIKEHGGELKIDSHCLNTRFVMSLPKKKADKNIVPDKLAS